MGHHNGSRNPISKNCKLSSGQSDVLSTLLTYLTIRYFLRHWLASLFTLFGVIALPTHLPRAFSDPTVQSKHTQNPNHIVGSSKSHSLKIRRWVLRFPIRYGRQRWTSSPLRKHHHILAAGQHCDLFKFPRMSEPSMMGSG